MAWTLQQIIDINGRERIIQYARVVKHTRMDLVNGEITVRYIEVLIMGKQRKWKEWYPFTDFMEANPRCKIDD